MKKIFFADFINIFTQLFFKKNILKIIFTKRKLFFYFLFFIFFSACVSGEQKNISVSFYFWRTKFNLNTLEKKFLTDCKVSNFYVKILDIDWSEENQFPIPVAAIDSLSDSYNKINITPVIFITNRTFVNISEILLDSFAQALVEKCFSYPNFSGIKEIQFDCDWTETTRDKYFNFLKKINAILNISEDTKKNLSATIRLHQYKYFKKTGVPPVQNGMLMVYNLNAIDDTENRNAILDLSTLKSYLISENKYPIPLNVALPLYSQGVLLRDGKAAHLFNNLTLQDAEQDSMFQKTTQTIYTVKHNGYFKEVYIYADDRLRIDEVSKENLSAAYKSLLKYFNADLNKVTFFSLDSLCLKRYDSEDLKTGFRKY